MKTKPLSRRDFLGLCALAVGVTVVACAPSTPLAVEKPADTGKEVSKEITECARDGDIEGVKSLIEKGAGVNAQDQKSMTPLLYAAREGHTEVAELLISEGADVAAVESASAYLTALHFCAVRGHRDTADLLISKGADVDAENLSGNTPLHLAAYYGHRDVAELLIVKGADIDKYNTASVPGGRTPLHTASEAGH